RPLGAALKLALRRKDGSTIPIDIALAAQPGPDQPHAIAAVRDITERHRMEEELRRAKWVAERALERIHCDLQVAALVQPGLLPVQLPGTERIHLAWEYLPCAELGGDGLVRLCHLLGTRASKGV